MKAKWSEGSANGSDTVNRELLAFLGERLPQYDWLAKPRLRGEGPAARGKRGKGDK